MLTGWPPATGSAALAAVKSLVEQPGRAESDPGLSGMKMDHLHATRAFDLAPLQPSPTLPAARPRRPREAMPLSLHVG
eukprot:5706918-Prymnesium_polylepis.1